jgi:ABC-type bacteriocin/lantibiotic exporter with double-glycine peptidase domain
VLSAVSIARVFSNAMDILGIATIGLVIAVALGSPLPESRFLAALPADRQILIVALLSGAALLFAVKTALGIALSRFSFLFLAKIEAQFSSEISSSLFSGTVTQLKRMSRSEIDWSILRSTNVAFTVLLGQGITLVSEASLAILVLAFLLVTDWTSAIVVTVYVLTVLAIFHFFSHKVLARAGERYASGSVAVASAIGDLVVAFRELRLSSHAEQFIGDISSARTAVARASATNQYLSAVPRLIVELALILGAIGFIVFEYVTYSALNDVVTFGVFLMGSVRMMSALLPLQRSFMSVKFAIGGAKAAHELLRQIPSNVSKDVSQSAPNRAVSSVSDSSDYQQLGTRIEVRNLCYRYDDSENRGFELSDITLDIPSGSFVALIGASGSGKSTIVDLLLGLQKPSSGQVTLDGLDPETFRRINPDSIGYVPQKPGLIAGTVAKNITLRRAGQAIDESRLARAIESAGLNELIRSLPAGVESPVGKHSDAFSGGQMQRLGLARALFLNPKLLILDEATSALDVETEATITSELKALRKKTTLVVIAHRLSTIKEADKIYVVERGTISASGSYEWLSTNDHRMKKYR